MGIRKFIADALELQHDVALNLPVVHLTGGERLMIENHKGLLEYSPNRIRIASSAGTIDIEGDNLAIQTVGGDDILLTGSIRSVVMQGAGVAGR